MKVFYSEKQVVDQGTQGFGGIKSPSARKPKDVAEALRSFPNIEFVEPQPLTIDDLKLAHDPNYVDGIMNLTEQNGFGNISQAVNDSLLYTNGAMYEAAKAATVESPTCALVSGFHHAGYDRWKGLGYFCTFNGLIISAMKLLQEGRSKIAVIDCDMHFGNGTEDILDCRPYLRNSISHTTFGLLCHNPKHANMYLSLLELQGRLYQHLSSFKPDLIIYQAGADVHVEDPYGGILTTEEMFERDIRFFRMAKDLDIPVAWNLAGGYQIDPDGSIQKVIDLHLNTFRAKELVYG